MELMPFILWRFPFAFPNFQYSIIPAFHVRGANAAMLKAHKLDKLYNRRDVIAKKQGLICPAF
jgi:hypothetical protein